MWLEAATVSDILFYLVRENLIFGWKKSGILKSDVSGNHVNWSPQVRKNLVV